MKLYYEEKNTESLDGETFVPCPLNEQYLISNFGRIKSKKQVVRHNHGGEAIKKERIMTQVSTEKGYLSVGLTFNGKTKQYRVSRLVAITFIPNPENKPQVNHKNGIKKDNRVENLEWNTSGENIMHAWNNDLAKKQKSFLDLQQYLECVNGYLTHKPRVTTPIGDGTIIIDQNCYRIRYDNGRVENFIKSKRFWGDDFKIHLFPLPTLTKEIEHKGEQFVPLLKLVDPENTDWDKMRVEIYNPFPQIGLHHEYYKVVHEKFGEIISINPKNIKVLPYHLVEKLISWNFDIFGLLERGIAIDKTTIQ